MNESVNQSECLRWWLAVFMGGWTDGWMDEWMDRCIHRGMYEYM